MNDTHEYVWYHEYSWICIFMKCIFMNMYIMNMYIHEYVWYHEYVYSWIYIFINIHIREYVWYGEYVYSWICIILNMNIHEYVWYSWIFQTLKRVCDLPFIATNKKNYRQPSEGALAFKTSTQKNHE